MDDLLLLMLQKIYTNYHGLVHVNVYEKVSAINFAFNNLKALIMLIIMYS